MRQIEVDDDEPYVVIEKHEGSVGSFLMGLAAGAAIALLFAPRSGVETRREIGDRARRVRDAAGDLVEDTTERVNDTFQAARDRVEERIEAARSALETKKAQVARAMEAGRHAAQSAREDLERRIEETKAAYRDAGTGGSRIVPATPAVGTGGGTRVTEAPAVGTVGMSRPRTASARNAARRAGTPGGAGDADELVADDAESTE